MAWGARTRSVVAAAARPEGTGHVVFTVICTGTGTVARAGGGGGGGVLEQRAFRYNRRHGSVIDRQLLLLLQLKFVESPLQRH